MKTIPEITALINKKIIENKKEVEGASLEIEVLTSKVDKDFSNLLDITMKKMILKDKVVFHKAVIAGLSDVLEEIQK
jgi:hypothetical protein